MSLSTLVEIYTLLCHEAEGELIYDSRNFICTYNLTGYANGGVISTIVEILYVFTPRYLFFTRIFESTIVEILYVLTTYTKPQRFTIHLR